MNAPENKVRLRGSLFSSWTDRSVLVITAVVLSMTLILATTLLLYRISVQAAISSFIHKVFRIPRSFEECPTGSVMFCPQNKMCITKDQRCDRFQDCPDDRDESNCVCNEKEHSCDDGRCISVIFICDGIQDCPLNDDESDVLCGNCSKKDEIRCSKDKKCISKEQKCDGEIDCPEADDESDCVTLSKSSELTLTHQDSTKNYVCAINWNSDMSDKICRHLGYRNSSEFSKFKMARDKVVQITDLKYVSRTIVIKSERISNCTNNELVKLKCTSEDCGGRRYDPGPEGYIINGVPSKPGQWPWHARLKCSTRVCGATIINNYWIITAAHCFYDSSWNSLRTKDCIVSVGSVRIYGDTVSMYRLEELVIHKDFKPHYPLKNDLALVKVNSRIRYNNFIQAICLAHQDLTTDDFRLCVSLGFGKTSRGSMSKHLLYSRMAKLEKEICGYEGEKSNFSQMCIGTQPGIGQPNICMGDSGGPFICKHRHEDRWTLMGVHSQVSSGSDGKADHELCQKSIISKISYYRDWIDSVLETYPI